MQHKWLSKQSRHSRNSTFAMFLLFMTYKCSQGEDCEKNIQYFHSSSNNRILNKFKIRPEKEQRWTRRLHPKSLVAIVLPWCGRVQHNIPNMLWMSWLVACTCVGSWTDKNRPVQVISVTCLLDHPREAIYAKGIHVTGRVFKTCLKHSYGNVKLTFCDDFLDGDLMSSNSKHSSDEAATAAGTSATSTDSWARPGAHQLPAWIKKFLHFPRG